MTQNKRHTVRNGLDFRCGAHWLIGSETTLGVDQVGCEDSVNQCGFTQTGLSWIRECKSAHNRMKTGVGFVHTDTHDIELETALQQLPLNLGSDAVETNMAVGEDGGLLGGSSTGSGSHVWRCMLPDLKNERS